MQEQLCIKQAGEAAEREVSYRIATLKQLKSLLKPLADNAEKSVETQIEYERIGKQAISECEQIIEEVLGLDFCSAIHFKALEKIKSVIDRARGSLRSPNVYAQLTATLTQLRGIQAECIKEAESYTKFSVELDKYKELYMKLRGMLSAGGSKLIDEDGFIENPANIDFAYSDDEQQIAMLADRNAQLESIINQSVQHTFCAGMSAILHKSSWGTEFKREKRADDSVHLSYVRKADKGAIFDVSCGANGEIAIVPKGVILSNGHATISAAELAVKFNRPSAVYVWLKVSIVKNPDEAMPPNYEALVKETIMSYAEKITAGENIVIQKVIAPINVAVSGIAYISIKAFTSTDASTTPADSDYTLTYITVTPRQKAYFDESRIEVEVDEN